MSTRILSLNLAFTFTVLLMLSGCAASLPKEKHDAFSFPESQVYLNEPEGVDLNRPFEVLGWVRTKERYPTLEQDPNNHLLCRNYYNKGVRTLLKEAKKIKGDAVIRVRSVVLLMNGKIEEHPTPECSDDGAEGEVLLRGVAIRWKPAEKDQ